MYISSSAILLGIFALSSAGPVVRSKRAGVLTAKSYSEFQISDGVAGNAFAEVTANFPVCTSRAEISYTRDLALTIHCWQIDTSDLAGVATSDLQIIQDARVTAEDAEIATGGFDDELAAAASGTDTTTLQNGKIKNKVLKLQLEVLGLQIQAAQGDSDATQDKIDEETTKLNTNIALDKAAAGQDSVGVTATFSGE